MKRHPEWVPFYFLFPLFVFLIFFTGPQRAGKILTEKHVYYAPPAVFQHFHFGQKEIIADSFWLRLIQDLEVCGVNDVLEQSHLPDEQRAKCSLSWAYRMYDIITELAPKFRLPHAVGGITLSVLLSDVDGASKLFEKAIEQFPTDWPILYRASYFYSSEGNNPVKAAELAQRAAAAGAPDWLNLTSARLFTQQGKKEMGLRVLEDYRDSLKDERSKKIVQDKIDALKKQN